MTIKEILKLLSEYLDIFGSREDDFNYWEAMGYTQEGISRNTDKIHMEDIIIPESTTHLTWDEFILDKPHRLLNFRKNKGEDNGKENI